MYRTQFLLNMAVVLAQKACEMARLVVQTVMIHRQLAVECLGVIADMCIIHFAVTQNVMLFCRGRKIELLFHVALVVVEESI